MIFNIFDVLFFVFNCAIGYFVGRYFGGRYGTIGWILGVPLGFGLGIAALKALGSPFGIWYKCRPLRPPCRNGKCKAGDYQLLRATTDGSVFQCQCGDKYFRLGRTGRFLEILPDGSLRPYMRRTPFGKWQPDADKPPAVTVSLAKA
jgi:hypothetical protein